METLRDLSQRWVFLETIVAASVKQLRAWPTQGRLQQSSELRVFQISYIV